MNPVDPFFGDLNFTVLQGLGISCILGGIGYATDSQFTYCYIVEWVERLCKGDGDAIATTLLLFSIAFGTFLA